MSCIKNKYKKRILLLHGGWKGHRPNDFANFAIKKLVGNYEVVRSNNLKMLNTNTLSEFDLILPIWTFGKISSKEESALLDSVAKGLGYLGWHGNASSFLESRNHKLLLGGQFVAHPGGSDVHYQIKFLNNDPIVKGLKTINVVSEQYYLLIDPAIKVLASTVINGGESYWLKGIKMPVVWKRQWGKGRVFYCSLGHTLDIFNNSTIINLLQRGVCWTLGGTQKDIMKIKKLI